MFMYKNVFFPQVSSLYRYKTNGASMAELEDGVASTAPPDNEREYVTQDMIHD